ncbi:MAG TPA: hypothetical protein DDW88_02445 [Treponema sp.]|nr:hypothetical protein [Treponema sp.]
MEEKNENILSYLKAFESVFSKFNQDLENMKSSMTDFKTYVEALPQAEKVSTFFMQFNDETEKIKTLTMQLSESLKAVDELKNLETALSTINEDLDKIKSLHTQVIDGTNALKSMNQTVQDIHVKKKEALKNYEAELEALYNKHEGFSNKINKAASELLGNMEIRHKSMLDENKNMLLDFTVPKNWFHRNTVFGAIVLSLCLFFCGLFFGFKIKEATMGTIEKVIVTVYEKQIEKEIAKQLRKQIE